MVGLGVFIVKSDAEVGWQTGSMSGTRVGMAEPWMAELWQNIYHHRMPQDHEE